MRFGCICLVLYVLTDINNLQNLWTAAHADQRIRSKVSSHPFIPFGRSSRGLPSSVRNISKVVRPSEFTDYVSQFGSVQLRIKFGSWKVRCLNCAFIEFKLSRVKNLSLSSLSVLCLFTCKILLTASAGAGEIRPFQTGNPKTRKPETGNRNEKPESGIRTGNQKPESGIRNLQIKENDYSSSRKLFSKAFVSKK